jgi:ABC-type transporter Mla MlaB component
MCRATARAYASQPRPMNSAHSAGLTGEREKELQLSLRPLPERSNTVLVVSGSVTSADAPALCDRVRAFVAETHADVIVCDVGALVDPDLATVDALARLQLTARRLGTGFSLLHASRELQELLAFAGLGDVMPPSGLRVGQASGQAEEGEQRRGVEKGIEADDPVA